MPLQDRWKQDKEACIELQKLKKFVDFVAAIPGVTKEQKENAEVVNWLIENIDKPETYRNWCVQIMIWYDVDHEIGPLQKPEVLERYWSVLFSDNDLSVEATAHTNSPTPPYYKYGRDGYSLNLNLNPKKASAKLTIRKPIDDFVAKAMNYKKYITDKTTKIDIELERNIDDYGFPI